MQHTVTSVTIKEIKDHRNMVVKFMYECNTYLKGFPNKIIFKSGLCSRRDDVVSEVLEFLRKNPQYINEWVN